MSKSLELIRAESRFQSFFGYLPGVIRKANSSEFRRWKFSIARQGKGCQIYVAKPGKCAAKYTLSKLSDVLGINIDISDILASVPIERVISACDADIVTGSEITRRYEIAHGSTSCMSDEHSEKAGIYANNPDVCGMLVGHNSFLCDAFRALTWSDKRGLKLDRLYGNQSKTAVPHAMAAHFASQRGLQLRTRSACGSHFLSADGRKIHAHFVLDWDASDPLPYMDTVRYLKSYTRNTVTIQTRETDTLRRLDSQSGESANGTELEPACSCESCGCNCDEEQLYFREWYNGGYCESCDDEATGYCEHCEELCDASEMRYVELERNGQSSRHKSFCEYCFSNEVSELHDGLYALTDDCQELHNGDYALTDDCQELHNGDYALTEDCQELHDGDYALTEDCQELRDGTYALLCESSELRDGTYALTDDCIELHDGTNVLRCVPSGRQLAICFADNPR